MAVVGMEASWQDYATWAIGAAALVAVAVRIVRMACGRRRGGCASCGAAGCPLHGSGLARGRRGKRRGR
ncbi:hypothetical protein [uncultured Alistipes sp.]|uniref:hypothetical protein n=1 Tax=uncultured Alistipes sp. TaxID=538949 RepID=UPI0026708372|nr:hypothetical protein [uncultured Alistipes sp.]